MAKESINKIFECNANGRNKTTPLRDIFKKTEPDPSYQNNLDLIQLALKLKMINKEKQSRIMARIDEQQLKKNAGYSVTDIFIQDNYISKLDLTFLITLQRYLKDRELDYRFGELAVANGYTTKGKIKDALAHQNRYFADTGQNIKIGDILIKRNQLSPQNVAAILLTQNRIKDEFLANTINDLASSEKEKLELSRRFGAIAINNGYTNREKVIEALMIQQTILRTGKKKKFLGEILKEIGAISEADVVTILKEQKQFEKDRLNLEKALQLLHLKLSPPL
ncbi:MAG: hypothetical protein GY729_16440 [Desulfobacteraceae bacterium]|nr:hypothetical protein [Desulfobacteraceae bacterium]